MKKSVLKLFGLHILHNIIFVLYFFAGYEYIFPDKDFYLTMRIGVILVVLGWLLIGMILGKNYSFKSIKKLIYLNLTLIIALAIFWLIFKSFNIVTYSVAVNLSVICIFYSCNFFQSMDINWFSLIMCFVPSLFIFLGSIIFITYKKLSWNAKSDNEHASTLSQKVDT